MPNAQEKRAAGGQTGRPQRRSGSATRRAQYTRRASIVEIKSAARGRCVEILDAAGIPANLLDGRNHPCPLCVGRDRFAAWRDVNDRGSVHCRHCFNDSTDPKPGDVIASIQWIMGCDTSTAIKWLAGYLGMGPKTRQSRAPVAAPKPTLVVDLDPMDMTAIADEAFIRMSSTVRCSLALRLGLPMESLERLRVGTEGKGYASTWPMQDHTGRVIGIRVRAQSGSKKWSVKGGKAGVFVPTDLPATIDRLFITEGPTDCGALLSLGFHAIGRPAKDGAVSITTKIVERLNPREVVIVADDDASGGGLKGADNLASVLVLYCRSLKVITPPAGVNDVRDWVASGATADEVMGVVNAAAPRSIKIGGAS